VQASDENDLFCLHHIYVSVINLHLQKWIKAWVNHKIRTANNLTPLQLYLDSTAARANRDVDDGSVIDEEGSDYDENENDDGATVSKSSEMHAGVFVPVVVFGSNEFLLQLIDEHFPQETNENNIINYLNTQKYKQLKNFVSDLIVN
jgi:hypothetical protein